MQPTIAVARPPFVEFEVRAEEDRAATVEEGHYVAKDVHYALITPMGSKDRIERKVSEWLTMLEEQVAEGRFEATWLDQYKGAYAAWQKGQDLPETGTPIRTWPALSPSQVKSILSAHIRTVEDLAVANEETLHRIGMGARALKERAIQWLGAAQSTGKAAEQIAALQVANNDLVARNEALQAQLAALAQQVEALASAKTGAIRKL